MMHGHLQIHNLLACFLALLHQTSAFVQPAEYVQVKRSVTELSESYDYVVIGGGTSGLTVANRLSEDTEKTVLVVELGYFGDEECIWRPKNMLTGNPCVQYSFNDTTVPQPMLNNQTIRYVAGAVVGGSSAVNGMFFDRGARADYDAFEELGNPGWGWDSLLPYFKKSVTLSPPIDEGRSRFNYTWDATAYGDGPVYASYPPFQWASTAIMWEAWAELNITGPKEHALGDAVGRFWVPTSQDPVNQTRSYARYAYYDPIKDRANYHLLIGHKAEKLVLGADFAAEGVVIYDRTKPAEKFVVKAKRETVLAAGAVHTPQILELSGIGPRSVLEAAAIETKVDLPGVGENFQDHAQPKLQCTFTKDLWPNPSTLVTNATYAAEVLAEYRNNKTGPLTMGLGNTAVFLTLNTTHSSPATLLSALAAQEPGAYLRPGLSGTVIAGYVAQKKVLGRLFASAHTAVYESPFSGACSRTLIMQKPLSRGSIHIDPSDPFGSPMIDFRVFSNPLDVDIAVEFIKFTRKYIRSSTLASLVPVETNPGANVTDRAGLDEWVRRGSGPTSFHASGTAAMMPRELGGVVNPNLLVYGTKGLSIVDASLLPLIPSTHLSATVYAIAEKAADIIKSRA